MLVLPDRLSWLADHITPAVVKLAQERLLGGNCLIEKRKPTNPKYTRQQVKLALLLVYFTNPFENMGEEEEALIRGMSNETLKTRREQKRIHREL